MGVEGWGGSKRFDLKNCGIGLFAHLETQSKTYGKT